MTITIFTSNQARHLSLIKDLARICETVYTVIEVNTIFPGRISDFFKKSEIMQNYFSHVIQAEQRVFGDISILPKNVRSLIIKSGDLNNLTLDTLSPTLNSDEYVVFGASFIKAPLIDFLVSRNAYNIHMGISPYYRGNSCTFWAAKDKNFEMVGATIHLLSKGLDSGPILFHTLPGPTENPFELGMIAVKSAHIGLTRSLENGALKNFPVVIQDKSLELKYTRNSDFDDNVALEYLNDLPTSFEIHEAYSNLELHKYIRLMIL